MTTSASRTASATSATRSPASAASGRVVDAAMRKLDDPDDLGTIRLGRPDLHQGQLVLDGRLGREVLDLEHVDQAVELLRCLLHGNIVATEGDRHPADFGLVRVTDRERFG